MEEIRRIKDIKDGENVVIEGIVLELFEPKKIVKKNGETIALQEILVDDGEDGITLKLWGNQAGTVKENQKLKIQGYVSSFKDTKSISTGKYGKIEVVS